MTCTPERRARRSAGYLALYSLTLLGLAIAASRFPPAAWVAALFSPLGHEYLAVAMGRREMAGEPLFIPPKRGVRVLDVMPGSIARAVGLRAGDVILDVNEAPVDRRADLLEHLEGLPGGEGLSPGWLPHLSLTVRRGQKLLTLKATDLRREGGTTGLVFVPEDGDGYNLEERTAGNWRVIAGWLSSRLGRFTARR